MIKLIFTATIAIFILSGCSGRNAKVTSYKNIDNKYTKISIYIGKMSVRSLGAFESNAFRNALEASATATIKRGYKYFAIMEPYEVATYDEGDFDINTAKEILNKCERSAFNITKLGSHICDTYYGNAKMKIKMYHDAPKDFLVVNAQDVITYFKEEGLYEDLEIDFKEKYE